jgi:hypothetical protein
MITQMVKKLQAGRENWDFIAFSLTCPLNRNGTREEHRCDDWELFDHPEFLVNHLKSNGGVEAFMKKHGEYVEKICSYYKSCPQANNCRIYRIIHYWKDCPLPRLKCVRNCPPIETIEVLKRQTIQSRSKQSSLFGLCSEKFNLEEAIIALTCPVNRDCTRRERLCDDFALFENPDWLLDHFSKNGGTEEFKKRREEFLDPICDVYDECGLRKFCKVTHVEHHWLACTVRSMTCKGNCTYGCTQ